MAPRIIDGWERPRTPPRTPLVSEWVYEYNRIIGQIDLKISTDEEPQTKFEGEITDNASGKRIIHIFCDQKGWRSFIPGVTPEGKDCINPGPKIPTFNNMEELAVFMVAKAGEI